MATQEISANGDLVFFLKAGLYEMSTEGTVGGSTQISLKGGGAADGTNHVQVTDVNGDNVQTTAGAHLEPTLVQGGGYRTLTTASYSGSSDLKVHFRRADAT